MTADVRDELIVWLWNHKDYLVVGEEPQDNDRLTVFADKGPTFKIKLLFGKKIHQNIKDSPKPKIPAYWDEIEKKVKEIAEKNI